MAINGFPQPNKVFTAFKGDELAKLVYGVLRKWFQNSERNERTEA